MTFPANGFDLLDRAISYALVQVAAVRPRFLSRPTPCADWDLRTLLNHVNDSLAALDEGIGTGCIGAALEPTADRAADLVRIFRDRANRLRSARTTGRMISIGDLPLLADLVAATGAVEIAVHGWDIGKSCGTAPPIPPPLASEMLRAVPFVVPESTRHPQFAAPVAVPPQASPGDRLVAFLGRVPDAVM
ncbi:TIGR03086 family metal-binding protein [Saccharopolyspora sp. K220]|uniref:TIGR03086 family metal-binding protein n=1 Tax=Saccharopolyspora soli TaxID=2926618 RepID=UPI001F56024F|nr:TIGR03086 family metal-binding protein [Saccharopolyspora soli]MCI2421640.1 TIGR03086 family metal-binding protein [Saccharopolyspora soli]